MKSNIVLSNVYNLMSYFLTHPEVRERPSPFSLFKKERGRVPVYRDDGVSPNKGTDRNATLFYFWYLVMVTPRNCLKFELILSIKKYTPALKGGVNLNSF